MREMERFASKIEERQQQQFYGIETNLALQKVNEFERVALKKEFQVFKK